MFNKIRKKIKDWQGIIFTSATVSGLIIAANLMGLFQLLEWVTLDNFFKLRPEESIDPNIIIITIDESDINKFGHPLKDDLLANIINKIKKQNPTVIGLDIYRNLPVEPGHEELVKVFKSTPNLIGVEKATNEIVPPPPTLAELNQVGLADLILDPDGKIRRGFISVQPNPNEPIFKTSLPAIMAFEYLGSQNIKPIPIENRPYEYQLGKMRLKPLQKNDGGYVRAETNGYQILINFRGTRNQFETISLTELIQGNISQELFTNKMVFIGAIAPSLNDNHQTPLYTKMAGVVIHANIASQLVNAALEGRNFIKIWPDIIEYLWIFAWSFVGARMSWKILENHSLKRKILSSVFLIILGIILFDITIITIGFLAFLGGWWLPVAAPLFSLTISALAIASYKAQEFYRLASLDGLTQVVNRRYFDEQIYNAWFKKIDGSQYLSVILCDVDFFKPYNDTYGHQAGDKCLQEVAQAMSQAVRANDLVARYGGEEFVVILPNTEGETAVRVAQRICDQVRSLKIPHTGSKVNDHVTLSCGIASVIPNQYSSPASLIADADKALYKAKEQGRNRVILL